jgi:hypothetical protein
MSALPRPVKSLLAEPTTDASVMRVWAKVQLKRRVPAPVVRPSFVAGLALSLLALVVVAWPSKPAPVRATPQANVACAQPEPTAEAMVRQHARRPSMLMGARPVTAAGLAIQGEGDAVGALWLSIDDASRQGRTEQVAALLGEIGEHHADDPRAAEALYLLGSLQLDTMKRPGLAASSFRRALELQPSEELVPELWARLQEAEAVTQRGTTPQR